MEHVPRWNLQSIYQSLDCGEFASDLDSIATQVAGIRELIAEIDDHREDFPLHMARLLEAYQHLLDTVDTLGAYVHANWSVSTADEAAMRGMNKVDDALLPARAVHVEFLNALARNEDSVRALVSQGAPLEAFSFVIDELLFFQKHQMSEAEEALAADLNRSGTDAWGRLQEAVSSGVGAVWDEETGERKSVTQLRSMAFDANREVRQKAFQKELEVWKLHEIACAYAINGVKGTTISLDARRSYEDPLDRALAQSRISHKALDALVGALEHGLPMFRRYLKAKAGLLGIEKLGFFDLFAPVGSAAKEYPFDESKDFILEHFHAFHKPLGAFAKHAFEEHWIDAQSRPGKVGGGYCTSFPLRKETRILCNYDGSFDSMRTLSHELGHAYHDKVTSVLPALLRQYPMTLAETASIFSQYIVFQGALSIADAQEKLVLIEDFLQDAAQVCVDILSRFYFERELFKRRKDGDLSAQELCSMMVDAQKRTYGDALDEQLLHPYMWAVKGHYYNTGLSFYNFPYAFGQLFALGVHAYAGNDPDGFGQRYDQLLLLTGQRDARDVAMTMGCDIEQSEFWLKGMAVIESYVDQFCALSGYGD